MFPHPIHSQYVAALAAVEQEDMLILPVAVGAVRDDSIVPFCSLRNGFVSSCPATGWPSDPNGSVQDVMRRLFSYNVVQLLDPTSQGTSPFQRPAHDLILLA
jgi:hypothetical protein